MARPPARFGERHRLRCDLPLISNPLPTNTPFPLTGRNQLRYTVDEVNIAYIRPGDTVLRDEHLVTVCAHNLERDPFLGLTLLGDTYRLGHAPVQRASIIHVRPTLPPR